MPLFRKSPKKYTVEELYTLTPQKLETAQFLTRPDKISGMRNRLTLVYKASRPGARLRTRVKNAMLRSLERYAKNLENSKNNLEKFKSEIEVSRKNNPSSQRKLFNAYLNSVNKEIRKISKVFTNLRAGTSLRRLQSIKENYSKKAVENAETSMAAQNAIRIKRYINAIAPPNRTPRSATRSASPYKRKSKTPRRPITNKRILGRSPIISPKPPTKRATV